MGQKGHILVQKGLKMHEKRQKKKRVFGPKNLLFSGNILCRIGGTPPPPPPLNGQSLCSKKLCGKGGTPPPLNGQNPLGSF